MSKLAVEYHPWTCPDCGWAGEGPVTRGTDLNGTTWAEWECLDCERVYVWPNPKSVGK